MAWSPWSTAHPPIDFDGALFDLIKNLDMPAWATAAVIVLAMVLVAIFFITGADSASIIMASLSSNGSNEPRRGLVIFWGLLTGAVAAVMLLAGGDEPSEALSGLQRITIVAALPFVLVMLLLCFALARTCAAIRWPCGAGSPQASSSAPSGPAWTSTAASISTL